MTNPQKKTMSFKKAVSILRKRGRVIAKLCEDTGLSRGAVDAILEGKTKQPKHETADKIVAWVEEN